MTQKTVSVAMVSDLVHYLVERGAELNELLHVLETTEEFISNPHNRLSIDTCERIWTFAETFTNDHCVGLHVGEKKSTAALGLISPLIQSCPDVWTAVVKAGDYMNVVSEAQKVIPKRDMETFSILFQPLEEWAENHPTAFRHVMACSISYSAKLLHGLTGVYMVPNRVLINYPLAPEAIAEFERVLRCPVSIDASVCGLEYDVACAGIPIQSRNIELMHVIEKHIVEILSKQQEDSFANKVKKIIVREYKTRFPSITEVSNSLALSTRNLQRKLKEEDTSFQELMAEIRKELAEDYLRNEALSISEISYMLGYAEPAVFTRAYKKWTGIAPESARVRVLA